MDRQKIKWGKIDLISLIIILIPIHFDAISIQ